MKNINLQRLYVSTVLFGLLVIPCFLAAGAEDEGTLGTNIIWISFAKLFYVLRFPTHTLLWKLISAGGPTIFLIGLAVNCIFYGLLTERIIYYIKRARE